ncbi:MAG TPA: ABC transporter ATP-binding protein [Gemmataceae bacterium]|nr:ABC transporter ATP-binding protein [Gemmataceae bacterium]
MSFSATPSVFGRLRHLEAQFLRPHRRTVALALAGMLVQSALLLPAPLLQGWVVDRLVAHLGQGGTAALSSAAAVRLILVALAASVACYAVRAGLAWQVAATMTRVSLEVIRSLTDAMHRKLQRLPVAYFDREQTGRVMARITSDVGTLLIFLGNSSLQLVSDLVIAVGIAATLMWLHWQLALIAFVAVPLYAINHRRFAGRLRKLARKTRVQVGAVYALLSERVSAVRVVRSFVQEEAEVAELDRQIDANRALSWSSLRAGAWQSALAVLISGVGTVGVLAYGVVLVDQGQMTVGALLAFYALLAQLYNPVVRLTQFQGTAAGTLAAVERIAEVFEEPETVTDRPGAKPMPRPRGALVFQDVSFAYRTPGPLTLDRVNLTVEPGMRVGILGASGSGKSTLLALAPRLYDVAEGQGTVYLDGEDVRGLRLADLRLAVGLVPQQAVLFEGTIRSNLTYARPNASAAVLRRALEIADLAAMVEGLPRGLETPVGERGFSLSGGQRQRLALARALVADPAVLLLDDCTSAVDADTESRIQAALAELLPGRTCLVVSHKVSSVRNADLIIVLHAGRVVERGTHEELLALGGRYAETVDLQTRAVVF